MTKNNTTTSMFKHNLRNSFCYYSGNIVIFSNLITVPLRARVEM